MNNKMPVCPVKKTSKESFMASVATAAPSDSKLAPSKFTAAPKVQTSMFKESSATAEFARSYEEAHRLRPFEDFYTKVVRPEQTGSGTWDYQLANANATDKQDFDASFAFVRGPHVDGITAGLGSRTAQERDLNDKNARSIRGEEDDEDDIGPLAVAAPKIGPFKSQANFMNIMTVALAAEAALNDTAIPRVSYDHETRKETAARAKVNDATLNNPNDAGVSFTLIPAKKYGPLAKRLDDLSKRGHPPIRVRMTNADVATAALHLLSDRNSFKKDLVFDQGLTEAQYATCVELVLERYDSIRSTRCTMPPSFPPQPGQLPLRDRFDFSVVAATRNQDGAWAALGARDNIPAAVYLVRNDLTATQVKLAIQLAESRLMTLGVAAADARVTLSTQRLMTLLAVALGKMDGDYGSVLAKRRALFSDSTDTHGAGVSVSVSRQLKLAQLRDFVRDAALVDNAITAGALKPYPAFDLPATGGKKGYAELNDNMVRFDILRYAPSAEAVRKVIDAFIAQAKKGFSERAMLVAPLENDPAAYMNFALAIIAECSYYHVRYNIALSRNYVHYVTQTPLDYDRNDAGEVIKDEDGNPRFSRANTGNFRAFLSNNLRIALDTKLSKKSRVLPTDTVLALSDLEEVRRRRAELGMIESEDRTDEHGLFAAVKDNLAMAALNETGTASEGRVDLDTRDGTLEFMPPVGGEDDRIVGFYDRTLKRREALLGELGVAPQPFGLVDYSALPELAAGLAASDEDKEHYLKLIAELNDVENLLRGLSHLPMVKSFGLGMAVSASDTSNTGYATTQLAACGAATTEAMATALSNRHIFASAFNASVKLRQQIAPSVTGFNVGGPRYGSPADPSIVNDQATMIATLQAFGEIPSLEELLREATEEWENWASASSVSLAPGNVNGAEIPWTPEQRVAEWNNDFIYPLVFDSSGQPSLNEQTASDRDYPAVVSPEYRSSIPGVQQAIADSTLPKGSEEHLRWIPTIETLLALTTIGASGLSHDGAEEGSFATPLTNVIRYWLESDVYQALVKATGMRTDFTTFRRGCMLHSNSFLESDAGLALETEAAEAGDTGYLNDDLTEESGNQPLPTFGGLTTKQLTWLGQFFVKTTENAPDAAPHGDGAKSIVPETLLGLYIATRLGKKLLDALRNSMLDADSHLYLPFAPMRASYAQEGFENGKQIMRLDGMAPLYTFDRLSRSVGPATAQQYITHNDEVFRKTLKRGFRDPNYDKEACLRDTVGAFDPEKGRTPPAHPEYLQFKNVAPGLRAMLHQLVAIVRQQREQPQVTLMSVAPGGGKTFLGIITALLAAEQCQEAGLPFRPLFLSPPKLIQNWHNDADKFTRGRVNVFTLDSDAFALRDNRMLRQQILNAPINTLFVGSYDMTKAGGGANSMRLQVGDHTSAIGARLDYLLSLGFTRIFFDESHRTKNSTGQLNRIAAQLNAQKGTTRILGTGTLISNMLGDAHGQLAAADPVLGADRNTFYRMIDHDHGAKGYDLDECQRYNSFLNSHTTMVNVQQRDWAYNLPLPVYTTHVANSYPKDAIDNLLQTQKMPEPGNDYLEALRYLAKFKLLGSMSVTDMMAEDMRFNTFMQTVYVYLKTLKNEAEESGVLNLFNNVLSDTVDANADDDGDGASDEGDDEELSDEERADARARAKARKDAGKANADALKAARSRKDGESEEEAQNRSRLLDKIQQVQQGLIPALTQFVKDAKAAPFNGEGFAGMEGVDIKQGQLDLNIITPAVKYCYYLLHRHFFNGSNKPAYSDMGGKKVLVVVQNVRSAVAVFRDMPSALKRHARLSFGAIPPNIEDKVNPAYLKDFDVSQAELVASKYAFCNDPNVWILVCTEKSVSEGYNFQIANRVIRIDIPFTPGEVKQTKSRVIRPDVSETYVRDNAYIDTIVTEHTIDIARFLVLTSKTLQSLAFEFNRDPLYAEATKPSKGLPLVSMNIDTLMQVSTIEAMSHFTNGSENEDGTLRVFDYVSREREFHTLELKGIEQELETATRLCKKYGLPTRTALREDGTTIERPNLMVKLETSGLLEGSAMTLFEPAVDFVPCHKLRYLGLKVDSLDYVLNGTTEIADNLIDGHVYTEHGFGRLIDLNRAKGKKRGDNGEQTLGNWATARVLFPDGTVGNYPTSRVTLVEGVKPEHETLLNSMIDTEAWQKDGVFQTVSLEAIQTAKGMRFQKYRLEWNGKGFVRGEALWGEEGSDYLNHCDDIVRKSMGTGSKVTVTRPAAPYTDGMHLTVRVDSGVTSRTAKEMVEEVGIGDGDWISDGDTNYRVNFRFQIAEGNKSSVNASVVLTPYVDGADGKAPVVSGKPKTMTLAKFISSYGFKPQLLPENIARQAAMTKVRRAAITATKKGFVNADGSLALPGFYNTDTDMDDSFQLVRSAKVRFTLPQAVVFALLEGHAADSWNALAAMFRNDRQNFTAFYAHLTGKSKLPVTPDNKINLAKAIDDLLARFQRASLTAEKLNIDGVVYGYLFIGEGEFKDFAAPLGTDASTMVGAYTTLAEVAGNTTLVASYSGILKSAQAITGWLEQQTANPHTNFLALPSASMRDGKRYITFADAVSEAGGAGNLIAQSADLARAEEVVNPYDDAEELEVSSGVVTPQETYAEPEAPEAPEPEVEAQAPAAQPAATETAEPRFAPGTFVAPNAAEVSVESYVLFTAPGSTPATSLILSLADTGSGDFLVKVGDLRQKTDYAYMRKDGGNLTRTRVKTRMFRHDTYRTLVRVTSAENLTEVMETLAEANMLDLSPFMFTGSAESHLDSWLSGFTPIVKKASNPNAFNAKVKIDAKNTPRLLNAVIGDAPIRAGKLLPVLCVADSAVADGDALYLMLVGFNARLTTVLRKLVKAGKTTVVRAQGGVTPLVQYDQPKAGATDAAAGKGVAMRQYEVLYSVAQHFAISADNFKAILADLKEYSTGMVKAKASRAAHK